MKKGIKRGINENEMDKKGQSLSQDQWIGVILILIGLFWLSAAGGLAILSILAGLYLLLRG